MNRVDLNLLLVFLTIARTRSVTLAAEHLSLSQPAISHALKRLRLLVGDPLFVRGREGLVLTPRAEILLPVVGEALTAVEDALAAPRFDPDTTTRGFSIAASDYSMMTVMPAVVRQLRRLAPRATIQISQGGPETLAAMEAGELDMSFWGAETPGGAFEALELFRENYVGLVCTRHPLALKAAQGKLTVEEFVAYPHVIATLRDARASPVERALAAAGHHRRIGMTSPNFLANMASLPDTDLVMAAPSRLAALRTDAKVVAFQLPLAVPDYPYSIVWHSRATHDDAHKWLREVVLTAAILRPE